MKKEIQVLALLALALTAQVHSQGHKRPPARHIHPEMYVRDTIHIGSDSSMYFIDNLGPNVNKEHQSAGARVSPDGKTLYYFKVDHPENLRGTRDIWVSEWSDRDTSWHKSTVMPEPVNNYGDNLVHWVSKDGNKLLLHNRYSKNKMSKKGLSMSERQADGTWSFPRKIKIKGYKNSSVCSFEMSPDEEVLISAINQPNNTIGQQDLYVSFKRGPYKYSKPENMGKVINTKGIEATAFLAPNGQSIYFSSNGHRGSLGGFDIYESKRLDSTWLNWSKPRHIGAPFNTKDDDLYFSVPDSGDYVYLSRHFGGNKDTNQYSDIIRIKLKELDPVLELTAKVTSKYFKSTLKPKISYQRIGEETRDSSIVGDTSKPFRRDFIGKKSLVVIVEDPEHKTIYDTIDLSQAKPGRTKMLKQYKMDVKPAFYGAVYSAKDSITPIKARVSFYEKDTKKLAFTGEISPETDSLFKVFAKNGKYTYSVKADGYLKDTSELDMATVEKQGRVRKNFYLQKIEIGLTFTIKNILFKYNSHILESYSFWELDRVAEMMRDAPNLEVEIGGHTDNAGNDAYNMALSQRRANSVVTYLKSKGISNKVHAKGYGETKPIDTNVTPVGRGNNRRVEFVVLSNGADKDLFYKPVELKKGVEGRSVDVNPIDITK